MKPWQRTLIKPHTEIVKAIEIIDSAGLQIALVIDEQDRLVGTITDGDVRRALLKGVDLQGPVTQVMNAKPVYVHADVSRKNILEVMKDRGIRHLPVVDRELRVVTVETLDSLLDNQTQPNLVILMAGGEGKRLFPLTKDCPKPLLKVGPKPILHTIIDSFVAQGFRHFYLSVNYKAEMVENYFGSGSDFGADIHYIRENNHLGTAGALSLLPQLPQEPFIVMNGDLLAKVNFQHLLDFHYSHGADATVCVRQYEFQVPYGVVSVENENVRRIDEKPVHGFFVNAGIYVFNPSVLDSLKRDTHCDMTDLLKKLLDENKSISAFPLREYWLDIGRADDLERAKHEFLTNFSS